MIERSPALGPQELHAWASWRDEWISADVEKALAFAGLTGWRFDSWSDGDMQFMHSGAVSFDDLAKLRITFTPRRMVVEAVIDIDEDDKQAAARARAGAKPPKFDRPPLMVLVTMSWNATSDAEAT
jgi:hypothetical protein